jgi:hypothetical protein
VVTTLATYDRSEGGQETSSAARSEPLARRYKNRRTKAVKPAATRDEVYTFAKTAIRAGYPEAAAAAVICFEWLRRPENVLGGYIRWTDYRGRGAPKAIRIFHHKTGAVVLHPLQDGDGTLFYGDAEELTRQGVASGDSDDPS